MKIIFLLTQLLFLNSVEPLCSCSELHPFSREDYENYDLIVQGQVSSIENKNLEKIITLEVRKIYKGEVTGNSVEINSPHRSGYCGLNIGTGGEWIIYAYEEEGNYKTNSCTRSSSLPPRDFQRERVEDDIEFLNSLKSKNTSALEILNENRRYFVHIVPGKHETYDSFGYIDSLQVGLISEKKAPGMKLFSTVLSSEENMEFIEVQELMLNEIIEVRQTGNHLDLISGSERGVGNSQGEVRLCLDYTNQNNFEAIIETLKATIKKENRTHNRNEQRD